MPQYQIRGRNKPPVFDHQPGFGGGQVSYLRSALLQQNQASGLVNVDLLRLEDAVTRRGTDQLQTGEAAANPILGLAYFDLVGNEKLVRVKNIAGTVKVQTHDGTPASNWTDAAGWNPGNLNCEIVQGNNLLFFSNGTDNMRSWNGAAFTDMGTGFPNPPRGKYLLYATNRLIAAGDPANPDTVYFSNLLGEGVWAGAQSLRVGAGDGDDITGLMLWTNTLIVVFKRSSTWYIDINPATTVAQFTVKCISRTIGCVGPRAFAKVGADMWFFSDNGVRSLQRILHGDDTEMSPAISYPMQDVLDTINRAAIATICCTFFNDRFFAAIPTGNNTSPDTVLPARVMPDGPRWLGSWTGWAPAIFVRSYIGGNERLNIGMGDGRVLRWRDFVRESDEGAGDFQDAGTDYATQVLTRALNFGEPDAWKQGFTVEAEFNQSRATVTVTPVLDGVAAGAPVITASSALGFLIFPVTFPLTFPIVGTLRLPGTLAHSPRFREANFLVASTAGKLALRRVAVSAFIQTMQLAATT